MTDQDNSISSNFIRSRVRNDLASGDSILLTRFPPEPNGYLHIGHAKSICLNFGIAEEFSGACNLRFDDTNPDKENQEYVDAIRNDVEWLGFNWKDTLFTSDYFESLYQYAVQLIQAGKAYVCDLNAEQVREYRGSLTEAGKDSPYRNRSTEENLDLFSRMRSGEFKEGERVLRAKIDMASGNINLRDPAIYRIKFAHHHRTGSEWCIYPMYDYAHCMSDAIEGISHSLCTLEFEDHRPLYDWFISQIDIDCHPQQIEFARLSLDYTITSKRKLHQLVADQHVSGWDDPRMPTISGMRRRGYTARAIRDFCERIGITKKDAQIDVSVLENCVREDLDEHAQRALCVLNPIKVVIENYPEDMPDGEMLEVSNHPKRPELGKRPLHFGREIYIERDDFMLEPEKKFFRLAPGKEVRLRFAYCITCNEVIYDDQGQITELRCNYDPLTKGGKTGDGRKVKGIIHWVSCTQNTALEVHLYDRLFNDANPAASDDFRTSLNPESAITLEHSVGETSLADATTGQGFQFERCGYFSRDREQTKDGRLIFNRTVTLRDTWAKIKQQ